ncbi:MAG: hypothetical protein WBS24_03100 [Terriglobales bacterium]
MRLCLRSILALAFLACCAQGQESPGASAAPSSSVPGDSAAKPVQPSSPPIQLSPDASGAVSLEQIRDLFRYAQDREVENEKRLRDYTYIERQEERMLDSSGHVKKIETRTLEVLEVYGEPVERLIAKDDKPLSEADAKKEEEKIQKIIDKRKDESESDRRKRLEKDEKEREEDRKFVLEIADAFNFRLIGSETLAGRDTWEIDAEPRSGYQPKERSTKVVTKFKGRVWIDKAEGQWVKLDITAIDNISFGWFLARFHKGAHIVAEQTKINDEVWLPKRVAVQLDVRLALIKNINADVDQTFSDYKKFRTDSKITVVGEENRQ